jgi:hypothetical protein
LRVGSDLLILEHDMAGAVDTVGTARKGVDRFGATAPSISAVAGSSRQRPVRWLPADP